MRQPELFFAAHRDRLLVLDKVQLAPELFAALRPEIDADRRVGRFLLFGAASGEWLRQSGESLAGRVSYLELTPLLASELPSDGLSDLQRFWLRGGFPRSVRASGDGARTLGARTSSRPSRRATCQRVRRNVAALLKDAGPSVGATLQRVTARAVARRGLSQHGGPLLRRAGRHDDGPPTAAVPCQRRQAIGQSPKVYWRDSGLLHALLGLTRVQDLQGSPVAGASREGFVVEQVAAALPTDARLGFYRTAAGTEIDLVIKRGARKWGVEIKFSSAPKPTKGFWQALQDLQIDRAFLVAPVLSGYPLAEGMEVVPVDAIGGIEA